MFHPLQTLAPRVVNRKAICNQFSNKGSLNKRSKCDETQMVLLQPVPMFKFNLSNSIFALSKMHVQ